jgi:hypothetical protein
MAVNNKLLRGVEAVKWAQAIADRISDELPNLDEEDRKALNGCLAFCLGNHPDHLEDLIGTGIIEEDYFKDMEYLNPDGTVPF